MFTATRAAFVAPSFTMANFADRTSVLGGATALNVMRVLAAVTAFQLHKADSLPLVVVLPILLDGVVGALAPLAAVMARGGRVARALAAAWHVAGAVSVLNVVVSVVGVAMTFPADVAVLGTPAAACAIFAATVLAMGTHAARLHASVAH